MSSKHSAERAAAAVLWNHATFDRLVGVAESRALAGRSQSSLEWARAAASFAATNPTGELRNARLESIADLVAARELPASRPRKQQPDARRRVLHVVSEARAIGGLTRLAERWIQRDTESISSVVVTLQAEVVDSLVVAAEGSGGAAVALGTGDVVEQAGRLRELGENADIVVCHIHSGDPAPAVAFGSGYRGAPVAIVNHADHLFWWAPTRASLIVDFREVGTALTSEGRGYAAASMHELPLPVPSPRATTSTSDVRRRLGVGPDTVLALTVARETKFQDTSLRPHFAEMLSHALDRVPSLAFCAVGPRPSDDPWPALLDRYPGRIHVAGPMRDPQPYLDAADIYLDTFPFSSHTSLLEAAAASLPALTLDGHVGMRRTLGVADFMPTDADRPRTLPAYVERIAALAADAELRRTSGEAARAAYLAFVPDHMWVARAEDLYAALAQNAAHNRVVGEMPPPTTDARLLDYAVALLGVEQRAPLIWMFGGGMSWFDVPDRRHMRSRVFASRIIRRLAGSTEIGKRISDGMLAPRQRASGRPVTASVA